LKRAGDSKEESPISSLVGSDYGATLNTAFKEPKNSPFYLLKIPPLIRTATKCIEGAGDSKEESPISSLVGSGLKRPDIAAGTDKRGEIAPLLNPRFFQF